MLGTAGIIFGGWTVFMGGYAFYRKLHRDNREAYFNVRSRVIKYKKVQNSTNINRK